jgi:hypothetical protein
MDTLGASLRAFLTSATTSGWKASDLELSTSLAGVAQARRIGLGLVDSVTKVALGEVG